MKISSSAYAYNNQVVPLIVVPLLTLLYPWVRFGNSTRKMVVPKPLII